MKHAATLCTLLATCFVASVHAQSAPAAAARSGKLPTPEGTRTFLEVPYVTGGHERQKLDLFVPGAVKNPPLVVCIHGGGWRQGSKKNPRGLSELLAAGLAVASIEYRYSQQAVFPAQLEDCKAAVRWLRANAAKYGCNPERIGAWGGSAGGHLAALLGTTGGTKEFEVGENLGVSSRVQAVSDWYGPTDFSQMDAQAPPGLKSMKHSPKTSPESRLIGGAILDHPDKVRRANPITYITQGAPPFLIYHGADDTSVPVGQSQILAEALRKAGALVTFEVIPGDGHGLKNNGSHLVPKAVAFFVKHLQADTAGAAHQLAPLHVSANGHFLVDAQERPVFVLADTAWALVNRLKREEITEYLERRSAQGFNAVAAVLYAPGNGDISKDSINAYGRQPFALTEGRPDPTEPLILAGNDPAKPAEYDYWDHVDFALAEMKRLGFYGFLLPCWGNEVASTFNADAPNSKAAAARPLSEAKTAHAYGKWLAARYAGDPHIVWMLGGDRSAVDPKTGTDFRPAFRAMAAGVLVGHPKALISFHPQKAGLQSGDWFHHDAWLTFNSIQLWPEDQVRVITRDWNAQPAKPSWIYEGRYEGYWKRGYKPEDWGEWQTRQQAWQTVFAGAFGHTYGHELVFGFGIHGADWRAALDAPGARSMTHLATFMRLLPPAAALNRVPNQTLILGDEGKAERLKSDRITASRTSDGTLAMLYAANGRSFRVKMDALAAGPLNAWWFNPRHGQWHANGAETDERRAFAQDLPTGPGAASREFDPPGEARDGNDWVLLLGLPLEVR